MKLLKMFVVASALLAFASHSAVVISDAKARATFALAKTGAAYFTLANQANSADRLVAVTVPESVAAKVEIHTVVMEQGMMSMRELEQGLALAPGETVTLGPGGKHIMLMGLTGPLNDGESLALTLHFENSDNQTIAVPIVKM